MVTNVDIFVKKIESLLPDSNHAPSIKITITVDVVILNICVYMYARVLYQSS